MFFTAATSASLGMVVRVPQNRQRMRTCRGPDHRPRPYHRRPPPRRHPTTAATPTAATSTAAPSSTTTPTAAPTAPAAAATPTEAAKPAKPARQADTDSKRSGDARFSVRTLTTFRKAESHRRQGDRPRRRHLPLQGQRTRVVHVPLGRPPPRLTQQTSPFVQFAELVHESDTPTQAPMATHDSEAPPSPPPPPPPPPRPPMAPQHSCVVESHVVFPHARPVLTGPPLLDPLLEPVVTPLELPELLEPPDPLPLPPGEMLPSGPTTMTLPSWSVSVVPLELPDELPDELPAPKPEVSSKSRSERPPHPIRRREHREEHASQ